MASDAHAMAGREQGSSGGLTCGLGTEAQATGADPSHSQPGHALFVNPQTQRIHHPPQAGALFLLLPRNCHSACEVLESRGPALGTVPPPACGGSVLAGLQMHWWAGNRPERGLTRRLGTKAQATGANPSHLQPGHAPTTPQLQRLHRRLRQGSSFCYCLEIATAPVGFLRPTAQPSLQCLPLACGGSVLAGFQTPAVGWDKGHAGSDCCLAPKRQATSQRAHSPTPTIPRSRTPSRSAFTARLRQGPSSHYCLEIATALAGCSRPWPRVSLQCLPLAYGGSVQGFRRSPAVGREKGRAGSDPSPGTEAPSNGLMCTLANPHHTLFAVALTMGETAEVQLLVVQLRCSPWVPRLGACHHAMAYALQDSDDPPYSVATGRGYSRCLLPLSGGPDVARVPLRPLSSPIQYVPTQSWPVKMEALLPSLFFLLAAQAGTAYPRLAQRAPAM